MTVIIPGMNLEHERVEVKPRTVRLINRRAQMKWEKMVLFILNLYFVDYILTTLPKVCWNFHNVPMTGWFGGGATWCYAIFVLLAKRINIPLQEHDGIIERWKRKNMENLLELHNKAPVWNEGMQTSNILFVDIIYFRYPVICAQFSRPCYTSLRQKLSDCSRQRW